MFDDLLGPKEEKKNFEFELWNIDKETKKVIKEGGWVDIPNWMCYTT